MYFANSVEFSSGIIYPFLPFSINSTPAKHLFVVITGKPYDIASFITSPQISSRVGNT